VIFLSLYKQIPRQYRTLNDPTTISS